MATRQDFDKKVEKIKEIVGTKSLFIGRIPKKTKDFFVNLSKEEFDDDYGFSLKKLCDVYQGFYPSGNEEIENKINILAIELAEIKQKMEETPKKGIKTISGRVIGRKE